LDFDLGTALFLQKGEPYDTRMARGPSRVAVALATALLGFLAVQAASQPRVAPSRGIRRLELVDLIRQQDERIRQLRREVRALRQDLTDASGTGPGSAEVRALQAEVDELASSAGGGGLSGPGVIVILDDSDLARSPSGDPNDLVIHERDIQTVVNTLWAAAAEAVAVNGQRLTSASAVRCAGNTLLLHGTVQSPPYEIVAIGDPRALGDSLQGGPGMDRLLAAARAFGLRYAFEEGTVQIQAGTVVPELAAARPMGTA
jgi:uncharacterized protein YlxW (UPF0749 family)